MLYRSRIMTAPTIVFDLDGTLVDTAPDLVATLNTILAREGLPPVAYADARNMVGGGARHMIERGLARPRQAGGKSAWPADRSGCPANSSTITPPTSPTSSRPFPGVEAALDELPAAATGWRSAPTSSNGCRCACSTRSASRTGSPPSAAPTPSACPSPMPRSCAARSRAPAAMPERRSWSAISCTDIATARAAGTPVIAVDFGYTETPVAELGPDRIDQQFRSICRAAVFDLIGARKRRISAES